MIEQIIDRLELLIEENIRSSGEENSLMCHDRNFGVIQAIECIKKMEKQPKTDWIPCEVDMPKELGRYIVTLKDGRSLEAIYDNISKRFIMYEHEVIAWQPLPKPYKKEGAE